jgi:hypothetical protein
MGTKANPSAFCGYARAGDNEPIFTLRGSDSSAPLLIEQWASIRLEAIDLGKLPRSEAAKVQDARDVAAAMRAWREVNEGTAG